MLKLKLPYFGHLMQRSESFEKTLMLRLKLQYFAHLMGRIDSFEKTLDREDPLVKGMDTHSSILAWRIPWAEEPGWATVHGITKSQT